MAARKKSVQKNGFRINEYIVYPSHGVGQIIEIETQEVAGIHLELFVIEFEQDKMILRVPTSKAESVGMRKLAEENVVKKAYATLKGKARIKRTMWSRRAQEYETKINSGDLVSIAEVVRDLYRCDTQRSNPIQSANFLKPRLTASHGKLRPLKSLMKLVLFRK